MRRYIVAILVAITGCGLFFQTAASALSIPSQVLITEVRLGGETVTHDGTDYKQYVTLYNQGDTPVHLDDGWKLEYAKAVFDGTCDAETWSDKSPVLSGIIAPNTSVTIDYQLTDDTPGAVRISDAQHVVHDMVGWGEGAPCSETKPVAATPTNGKSIARFTGCDGTLTGVDTDDNSQDFTAESEPFTPLKGQDCTAICTGTQVLEGGVCVDDACSNITGVQVTVPKGHQAENGECHETPVAPDPPRSQPPIEPPALLPLTITELLPNAKGTDKGNEFIELYNPNDTAVDLTPYVLAVGGATDKTYPLPADTELASHRYMQIKDTDAGFTLPNTKAKVTLKTDGGRVLDETRPYEKPSDGEAWALIGDTWQYTNQPTPNAANVSSLPDENSGVSAGRGSTGESDLKPCAANQERNPETNRCRLIVGADTSSTNSDLAPCKEGQYRSEETNRCRSATSATATVAACSAGQTRNPETNRCRSAAASASSSTLTPCKPGQERNPATNRCRSAEVATTSELTPCKENQERNPDTNRCRAATAKGIPDATFATEPIADTGKTFTGWWILGGVGVLAAGRIGWEWRNEIGAGIRKVGTFFTSGK